MVIHADKLKTLGEEEIKLVYEGFFLYAGMWAIGGPVGGG